MKLSVRMTLFNFICLFALTLLAFSLYMAFLEKYIDFRRRRYFRRSQAGGMRMMHGLMARGRHFLVIFSWDAGQSDPKVVQTPGS